MQSVTTLTEENFQTFVDQSCALVDFYANWCGPCCALAPILEKLAKDGVVPIGKMDVDTEDAKAFLEQWEVRNIPTLLFFHNGTCIDRHVGSISEQDLVKKIAALKGNA